MFQNIGTTEIIIIAVVLLILFGASILPKFGRNLGKSGKELKEAGKYLKESVKNTGDEDKKS